MGYLVSFIANFLETAPVKEFLQEAQLPLRNGVSNANFFVAKSPQIYASPQI